jgi:hypothetical protein
MMAIRPDDRYPDARAVAQALRGVGEQLARADSG